MSKVSPVRQGLGIDVSKATLQICMMNWEADQRVRVRASTKVSNSPAGHGQLSTWLRKHRVEGVPLLVVLEATGIYHEGITYHLHEQGESVAVVLPRQAKHYAKSLNTRSKTDAIDAQILAQFALERAPTPWQPPSAALRRIKRLCRERVELQAQRTAALNQAHARAHSHQPETDSQRRGRALVKFLDKQIAQIEAQLEKTVAADPALQRKIQQICTIKGLGFLTVVTIVAETDGFALFHRKGQVVRFAGYDIVQQESGTSIHTPRHISHHGSKYIRRALYFPALTVVKYEKTFRALFDRVLQTTAIKMKAYVAVQRKLLVLIYTLYKNDIPYDPAYAPATLPTAKKNRQEFLPA